MLTFLFIIGISMTMRFTFKKLMSYLERGNKNEMRNL